VCDLDTGECKAESTAVYVLAGTGSSMPCGTLATPCYALDDAAAQLTAGRPNLVLIATQQEYSTIGAILPAIDGLTVVGNGVTVSAYSADAITVTGGTVDFYDVKFSDMNDTDDVAIRCSSGDIRIIDSEFTANFTAVNSVDCNVTVTGSTFSNHTDTVLDVSCTAGGDNCASSIDVTLERNRFISNLQPMWSTVNVTTVINNLFVGNGGSNYQRNLALYGRDAVLKFNTFVDNTDGCTYVGVVNCNLSGTAVLSSNLSWDNQSGCSVSNLDDVFYGCGPSNTTTMNNSLTEVTYPGANNISGMDPLFEDANNDDYRLSEDSPGLNLGEATNAPDVDIDGNPRTVGDGPDIGAFERQ
jgi:hypothetical protein